MNDLGKISYKKFFIFLIVFYSLNKSLIIDRPHLVYFTLSPVGAAFYRDAILVAIAKMFRIPILFHLRGKGIAQAAHGWRKYIYKLVFSRTNVICLSEELTKDISKVFSGKAIVVNNGIESSISMDQFKNRNPISSPVKILFLSNLVREKGIIDLIECASRLSNQNVGYTIDIVGGSGDISEQEVMELLRARNLERNVHVRGPVYGPEKYKYYLDADIFIFPTFYQNEAFPGVVLEAMQAGATVVAYGEGAIPEMLEHGKAGVLVKSRDVNGLCSAIKELIDNPTRAMNLALIARQQFDSKYTEQTFEARMLNAFQKVIEENQRS